MCANGIKLTSSQWQMLPQELKDICKANKNGTAETTIARMLNEGKSVEFIFNTLKVKKNPDTITGLTVESADTKSEEIKAKQLQQRDLKSLDALKPDIKPGATEGIEGNKKLQESRFESWKKYFTERYNNNPEELNRDYIKIEKRLKVKNMAENMMKAMQNDPILMKTKYFSEGHATADEKKVLDESIEANKEFYSEQKNISLARAEYNNMMKNLNKKNPVGTGEQLTESQIKELALYKAYNSFEIGADRIKSMAEKAVEAEHFNKALTIMADYEDKIAEAATKLETKESKAARREFAKKDIDYQNRIARALKDAETEKSKELRLKFKKEDGERAAAIEKALLEGNTELANELKLKRAEAEKAALKDLEAALDPDKKKIADDLATERMAKLKEFNEKLPSLQDKKVLEKIKKLELEREEKVKKVAAESKDQQSKVSAEKMAEALAEAQIDKEIAQERIKNTVVHWNNGDKNSINKNDGKNHTFPFENEDAREYIIANGDEFGDEVTDGSKGDYEFNGKQYKFSSDKFKARMVQMAGDHGLDNEYAKDEMYGADLYAQLYDRKELIDRRVNDEERSVQTTDKQQISLKERRFARDMFKAAGLDVGKDQTVAKRWGHVGLGFVKGAVAAGSVATFHEWLSTMPTVEKAYSKLAKFSKVVPYSAVINYSKTHNVSLTDEVTLGGEVTGTTGYSTQVTVEGLAKGEVGIQFEKDYDYEYEYSGNLTGTFKGSGKTPYSYSDERTIYNTSQVYENGRLKSEITTPKTVTISGSGMADFKYEHDYKLPYSGKGSGTLHINDTVYGQAEIPYSQTVNVEGETTFKTHATFTENITMEGDVLIEDQIVVQDELLVEGEKVVEGKTKARKKMSKEVIGGATLSGGIMSAANAASQWNTIYDDTDNEYATTRAILGDKNVDYVAKNQPTPPPVSPTPPVDQEPVQPAPPVDETPAPAPAPAPAPTPAPAPAETVKAEAKKAETEDGFVKMFPMKGKLLADVIAKAYGITDRNELYDAIGVVKEWHGIAQSERHKNIWIANLGMKEELPLPNGKKLKLVNSNPTNAKALESPDDYYDGKDYEYRSYQPAKVEVVGNKVIVTCGKNADGSIKVIAEFDAKDYSEAQNVANKINTAKLTPEEFEKELDKWKKDAQEND